MSDQDILKCPICGNAPTCNRGEGELMRFSCCNVNPIGLVPGEVAAVSAWNYAVNHGGPIKWENWSADPKQESGSRKAPLHLIPPAANEEMAKALDCGRKKYKERNWLLGDGVNMTVYLSAMLRHIGRLIDGEDIDPESGAHHLGHVLAGAAIVLDAQRHGKLIDDRVLPPAAK